MGNQTQTVSRFTDQNEWAAVAQSSRKQLIQNKYSREVVEKHFLQNVEWSDVKQDAIIFEWRKDPMTALCSVQIYQIRKINQEEEINCMGICTIPSKLTDLLVYTEHIYKLYEQNPKCYLSERDQVIIFKGIIEGIDMLSAKFGEFGIAKDMVGYNNSKRGKAWINQNYSINSVQVKGQVSCKEQRARWEKEVITSLIKICRLCYIDPNMRQGKFSYATDLIQRHGLYQFSAFREFGQFREINLVELQMEVISAREVVVPSYSKETQLGSSRRIMESNELISTDDRVNRDDRQRVKIFNQTFEAPAHVYRGSARDITMPEQHLHLKTAYNRNSGDNIYGRREGSQPTVYGQNQVRVKSETFLNDAADYHYRHSNNNNHKVHHLNTARQQPEHYALLNELQQSRSSRSESRMIPKDNIKMVDSWVMVEQKNESEFSRHPHNQHPGKYVLQQSIIVRARK